MDNSKIISRFFIVKRLLKNIKVLSDNNIELILTYYWSFLPKKKVLLEWIDIEKLDWKMLSVNANAIDFLEANKDKINWKYLSKNSNAIRLLETNLDKISWKNLSLNRYAIDILKKNKDKIDYSRLVLNENAIDLIEEKVKLESKLTEEQYYNLDYTNKVCFCGLSSNSNAIKLLKENSSRIHWGYLSENVNALDLIESKLNQEEQSTEDDFRYHLSSYLLSTNKNAIYLLKENPDIINWAYLSENENAIDIITKKNRYENNTMTIDNYIKLEERLENYEVEVIDKICWNKLSGNPNGIELIKQKIKMKERMVLRNSINNITTFEQLKRKVDYYLSRWEDRNPNIIVDFAKKQLLLYMDEPLDWSALSSNRNAIDILFENQDKIDWYALSSNPSIFVDIPIPNVY
jgi:hypothetical protein